MILIERIALPVPGFEQLKAEARAEGYNLMNTLAEEWARGSNRFDAPGEILCGHADGGLVVAVGGINVDPYAGRAEVGRIRRIYVRPSWRNRGIGRALVSALIEEARGNFDYLHLRAENPTAIRLYESMGFTAIVDPAATHILPLGERNPEKSV
ncbi:MAG: GNAT family N-acetyltransferase [Terracidiphilus sp.]|jgi:GNAT superfamily N-acetyltransferase